MKSFVGVVFLTVFMSLASRAQVLESNKFFGFVQFVNGEGEWGTASEYEASKSPKFGDIFHLGQTLKMTSRKSVIKVVDERFCVLISYGKSEWEAPATISGQWRIKTENLRIICPESADGKEFLVGDTRVKMTGGEVFFHEDELLVVKGKAEVNGQEWEAKALLEKEGSQWQAVERASEYKMWRVHRELSLPKESLLWEKPETKTRRRWILSLMNGGGQVKHDESSDLDNDNLEAYGLMLQTQWPWRSHSLIAALRFQGLDVNRGDTGGGFVSNSDKVDYRTDFMFEADLGIRWWHEKSWSFYGRFGLGYTNMRAIANFCCSQGFGEPVFFEAKYLYGIATVGIEKIWLQNWLGWERIGWRGLHTGLELSLGRSFVVSESRTDAFNQGQNFPEITGEAAKDGDVVITRMLFYIGIPLQFLD